jgi:hypothetical protein
MRNFTPSAEAAAPVPECLGRVQEGLVDVRWSQVRVLGEDLVGRHPVRDHRHDRGNREAQPRMQGSPPMTAGSVVVRS